MEIATKQSRDQARFSPESWSVFWDPRQKPSHTDEFRRYQIQPNLQKIGMRDVVRLQQLEEQLIEHTSVEDSVRLNVESLATLYSIKDVVAVECFLRAHRFLVGLLFSAFPRINRVFGTGVGKELDLLEDPDDNSSSLIVHIITNNPNAYQTLESFDEEWWLDHVGKSAGLLNFAIRPE
jgi:hypothetical protein